MYLDFLWDNAGSAIARYNVVEMRRGDALNDAKVSRLRQRTYSGDKVLAVGCISHCLVPLTRVLQPKPHTKDPILRAEI